MNSFKIKLDGKRITSHNFCKVSWCSFRWTFNFVSSSLKCPDKTQLSNWNTQQAKVLSKHWYTQNSIPFFFFIPASYGVKTTKKHEIDFELSKTEHSKKTAFKNWYESADHLYKNLKIIKFQDLLRLNNCLLVCQLEQNKKLVATFPGLKHKEKHT